MSNGTVHRLVAAAAVGTVCLATERNQRPKSERPFIGAILAAGFTNVPDLLEPALHPHHRQFFHSIVFAGMLGVAVHKAYHWQPDNVADEAIRFGLLVCLSAYLIHLLLDAGTQKSLPLLGKF